MPRNQEDLSSEELLQPRQLVEVVSLEEVLPNKHSLREVCLAQVVLLNLIQEVEVCLETIPMPQVEAYLVVKITTTRHLEEDSLVKITTIRQQEEVSLAISQPHRHLPLAVYSEVLNPNRIKEQVAPYSEATTLNRHKIQAGASLVEVQQTHNKQEEVYLVEAPSNKTRDKMQEVVVFSVETSKI